MFACYRRFPRVSRCAPLLALVSAGLGLGVMRAGAAPLPQEMPATYTIFAGYLAFESPLTSDRSFAAAPGIGRAGMQIQNLDPTQDAQVVIDLYPQSGDAPVTVIRPNVAPGQAANFYSPAMNYVQGIYAAVISADRPIAAIVRHDWYAGGDAAIYSNTPVGKAVTLPLVAKQYGQQTSIVTIHNTDVGRPATVSLAYHPLGQSTPSVTTTRSIRRGTSITLDVSTDTDFAKVPSGSLGSLVVTSTEAPVGVMAFMDVADNPGLYAYEGRPSDQAATRLYAPLTRNDLGGTTGISVVNPADQPVEVGVTYVGSKLTPVCAGSRLHGGKRFAIGPRGTAIFYQGNVASLPTGDSGLPKRCLASAVIEATGGAVMAVVNDANLPAGAEGSSAAYNAVADSDGAREVAVPLFRNHHTHLDLSTGIQVMNIGAAPATLRLKVADSNGRDLPLGADAMVSIEPLQAHTWYPPAMRTLPTNMYGAATVSSDQPVVVIVNDASASGRMDAATFNGIKAE